MPAKTYANVCILVKKPTSTADKAIAIKTANKISVAVSFLLIAFLRSSYSLAPFGLYELSNSGGTFTLFVFNVDFSSLLFLLNLCCPPTTINYSSKHRSYSGSCIFSSARNYLHSSCSALCYSWGYMVRYIS